MGQKQNVPPPPPPPQKTVKEMVKEFTRSINKLRREFQREIMKLEQNQRKITQDIQNMIKKKEPRNTIRIVAQQKIKTENMVTKYKRLDAQLGDVQFQLNAAATTETLVNIMKGMGQVMKQSSEAIDVKNVQMALETFNMEVEKQSIMQEQIQDIMTQDEDDMGDEACDQLINEMEKQMANGGNGGQALQNNQKNTMSQDDTDMRINNLKDQ